MSLPEGSVPHHHHTVPLPVRHTSCVFYSIPHFPQEHPHTSVLLSARFLLVFSLSLATIKLLLYGGVRRNIGNTEMLLWTASQQKVILLTWVSISTAYSELRVQCWNCWICWIWVLHIWSGILPISFNEASVFHKKLSGKKIKWVLSLSSILPFLLLFSYRIPINNPS